MENKIAIKKHLLFIILIFSGFLYGQEKNDFKSPVNIKIKLSESINLNEDYVSKKESESEIVFSVGIETLGVVDDFIFSKKHNNFKEISFNEIKQIEFSSINELNFLLQKNNVFSTPNDFFKKINLVVMFSDTCSAKLYPVKWQRRLFIE